jgi:serine/threonine protein kinase
MNRNVKSQLMKILLSERLGSGRFGTVFPGKLKDVPHEVAIKRMEKGRIRIDSGHYYKTNGHPNLIGYYGTNSTNDEFV